MSKFAFLNNIWLNLVIFCFLLSNLFGQNIISEKYSYNIYESLNKSSSAEFISEVIEVPIDYPDPFVAVGLHAIIKNTVWEVEFYFRTSSDGVRWGAWQMMEYGDNFMSGNKQFNSALHFFNKESKYFQFKTVNLNNYEKLNFSFISPGSTPDDQLKMNKEVNLKKVVSGERPSYINRKDWGCPQSENVSSRTLTDVTHLIIHHSAGNTVSNDYAAVVRAYWDYHVNGNGWDDIGYNWLVDPNGVLYKGRAWKSSTQENVLGAHNSGKNGNTAGICIIGNYVSNIPGEEGLNMVASISAFLCTKYGIDPLGESYHSAIAKINDNIDGHGQSGGGTACPGTQVINRLDLIRQKTFNNLYDVDAAPQITSIYPTVQSDSAYLSKPITLQFSHPMNIQSVESSFSLLPDTEGMISWNDDNTTFNFKPSEPFASNTLYYISILNTAQTIWEVNLENDFEFSFTTKKYDNLSFLGSYPNNGDFDIPIDLTLEVRFDGPIDPFSLSGNISFVDEDSNGVSISVNSTQYPEGIISFKPTSPLSENSTFFIHLKKGIGTTDGYILRNDTTIAFTTEVTTSVDDTFLKSTFLLMNAYPNPFNPSVKIRYSIPKVNGSQVELKIFDALGKEIETLVDKVQSPGEYEVIFNAEGLPSGIYYYRLSAGSTVKSKKMILLK